LPWIVDTARRIRQARFVLDCEAVVLGAGMTTKCSSTAFDILALDGNDLRGLALSMRKANLKLGLEGLVSKHSRAPPIVGSNGPGGMPSDLGSSRLSRSC
jgi:ATP-dependent DNA ligase